jgi:hypothetical protein
LYKPDGTELGPLAKGAELAQELCVFKGDPQNQAWVCQMQVDKEGFPFIAYSVHKSDEDLRYRYYDGKNKTDWEFARAGSFLYKSQEHYTGNVAVDPADPHVMYFSTNSDPKTGEPLVSKADGKRHWELFKCVVGEAHISNGKMDAPPITIPMREITPVTENSKVDNIRPILPAGDRSVNVVLWLRGTYTSYTRWNMAAVAAAR